VVGRKDGVVELDVEGKVVRRFGRQPATLVRRLPGAREVFVTFHEGILRLVDPAAAVEKKLATVPRELQCQRGADAEGEGEDGAGDGEGGQPTPTSLFPPFEDSFQVSPDGAAATFELADAEFDMRYDVSLTVCLDTGKVYLGDALEAGCSMKGITKGKPPCLKHTKAAAAPGPPAAPVSSTAPANRGTFPFDVEDGSLVEAKDGAKVRHGDPLFRLADGQRITEASLSPSGRWALLAGPEFQSHSNYTLYLLLDRQTGKLYSVMTDKWPKALDEKALHAEVAPGTGKGPEGWIPYSLKIEWIAGAPADVLRVGGSLLHPGAGRIVVLGGEPVP